MFGQKIATLSLSLIMGLYIATSGTSLAQFIADVKVEESLASSLTDHQARLSNIVGDVKILRGNSEKWVPVKNDDLLTEGDQIKTSTKSSVDIIYDDSALNIAHIQENTLAEFRRIEPTTIYLTDGNIFNSLESLPKGQNYEIATETAVSGVRGTQFLKSHSSSKKSDSLMVSEGSVESFPVLSDGSMANEPIRVEKDQGLKLGGVLRSEELKNIKPESLSKENQAEMAKFSKDIDTRLEKSMGGAEMLRERRAFAKNLIKKPAFNKKLQELLKEQDLAMLHGDSDREPDDGSLPPTGESQSQS